MISGKPTRFKSSHHPSSSRQRENTLSLHAAATRMRLRAETRRPRKICSRSVSEMPLHAPRTRRCRRDTTFSPILHLRPIVMLASSGGGATEAAPDAWREMKRGD
jgi:hypothetical protein